MVKSYTCHQFPNVELVMTREEAINVAMDYATGRIEELTVERGANYVWRAKDGSGFTVMVAKPAVDGIHNIAVLTHKWNAARKRPFA